MFLRRTGREQVARDLLAEELVVGLVGIEGVDDPVAVSPGLGVDEVPLLARALGVPGDVQPVPAPPLAVLRRGEELIDDPFASPLGGVASDLGDLLGGRR